MGFDMATSCFNRTGTEVVTKAPIPDDFYESLSQLTNFLVMGDDTSNSDVDQFFRYYGQSSISEIFLDLFNKFKINDEIECTCSNWPVAKDIEEATDACWQFCNSQGLTLILKKCLNAANTIFTNITSIVADVDCFYDDYDVTEASEHISIQVKVNSCQNTVLNEDDTWVDWFIENIGPQHRPLFILTVHRM